MQTIKQQRALNSANQESRRITRESIREALFLLMDQKSYSEITISELIKKAGVSRSAFYRNYQTKEDILAEEIDIVANAVTPSFDATLYKGWFAIFKAAYDNKKKLQLILDAGLEQQLLRKMNESLPPLDSDYVVPAIWNGLIYNLVIEWVKRGMVQDIDEIARLATNATLNKNI